MAMASVGIDGRDHPILRDPPGDPEHPILTLVEVLANDRRQQRPGLRHARLKLPTIERDQQRLRVARERVDHGLRLTSRQRYRRFST
jgi:hypothetical protein